MLPIEFQIINRVCKSGEGTSEFKLMNGEMRFKVGNAMADSSFERRRVIMVLKKILYIFDAHLLALLSVYGTSRALLFSSFLFPRKSAYTIAT